MTSKEWAAVAVVIGGGILLQIPGHDDGGMDHKAMDEGAMLTVGPSGPFTTTVLDVTGMT